MVRQDKPQMCVSLSEAQAYARVENGEEEAVLAGLIRVASEICESFLNQALLARNFEQELRVGDGWSILEPQPVRSVASVQIKGSSEPLDPSEFQVDIDHEGRAFVSGLPRGTSCTVRGSAGMGLDPNDVPEAVRQGILRLAANLFANRDAPIGELPKAVTALWRPYRKAGLGR